MNIIHASIVVVWFVLDATNFDVRLLKILARALPAIATCALRGAMAPREVSAARPAAPAEAAEIPSAI